MNRVPQKRSSAIKNEPAPDGRGTTSVTPESPRSSGEEKGIPLGWRLAILVWVCGFVGLFAYELWVGLFWKLVGKP
jgi:hypothetical protein